MTDLINRARKALEGVLPGPWKYSTDTLPAGACTRDIDGPGWGEFASVVVRMQGDPNPSKLGLANLEFIRAARTLVPELVARLEELEATSSKQLEEVARLREEANALREQIDELTKERDESDRRVGAMHRQMTYDKDSIARREEWLARAKRMRGYDQSISFDVVWAETCQKAEVSDEWHRQAMHHNKQHGEALNTIRTAVGHLKRLMMRKAVRDFLGTDLEAQIDAFLKDW